jgi:hypothetical protein
MKILLQCIWKTQTKNPQTGLDRTSLEANGPEKQTTHISAHIPVSVKPIRSCHPLPLSFISNLSSPTSCQSLLEKLIIIKKIYTIYLLA